MADHRVYKLIGIYNINLYIKTCVLLLYFVPLSVMYLKLNRGVHQL